MANDPILGLDDPESIREMRERQLRLGLRLQSLGTKALEELEARVKAGQPLNLSTDEAQRLLDAGTDLEHNALDEKPDDRDAPKKVKVN